MSPTAAGGHAGGCAAASGDAAGGGVSGDTAGGAASGDTASGATPCAAAAAFAQWRGGQPGALDRLVRLLTPVLWQMARAYGLDRQAAEDAVQSTWLALVRHADTVRDPQAIWRWATTTTRREAWRLASARGQEALAEPVTLDGLGRPTPGPEAQVLGEDRAGRLWRLVGRLPQRCRRLLRVIAFEDRPDYASLSNELAMPVGSIGPTRGRCLDKLRRLLADDPQWSDE